MKWLPYPMIRIAGFFLAGILTGIYFPDIFNLPAATGVMVLVVALFFFLNLFVKYNQLGAIQGIVGLSAIFLLGYIRLASFNDTKSVTHFSKLTKPIRCYEAKVGGVPEAKARAWRVEIEMVAADTGRWQPVTGKLLLYVSNENLSPAYWQHGDRIIVRKGPEEIRPTANPGEFDFRRFFSYQNISHQQFAGGSDVRFLAATTHRGFLYYAQQARSWSMKKINALLRGERERAIAIALVLGVTDGVDNDLQDAYAASGAMHVLAVSGMHVGIIYAIVLALFKPLRQYHWSKWLAAVFSLTALWLFAFVTGLSPSVLRAVTMFSFIAMARPFNRETNIYNSLAASVFLLLIYNPYLIMSVGFQLSYLAVLGIVYLQRPLYNLWEIENAVGDWLWKITSVSLAAQAATFAISLLYFHQFPTYFLLSNLFVIPLSTLVLLTGIFLLMTSFILPFASLTAVVLEWLIKILNWIVFTTEALPFSLIDGIYISPSQCWLLMAILISLALLFEFRSIKWLYTAFGLTVTFAILQWNHFFVDVNQRQMVVYSVSRHGAIEFLDRGQSFFCSDALLANDPGKIRFHVQPNRLLHGVCCIEKDAPFSVLMNQIEYFRWRNKTIAWLKASEGKLPVNGQFDFLVISNNALSADALESVTAKCLIFDGSNSRRRVSNLLTQAAKNGVIAVAVMNEGAFVF